MIWQHSGVGIKILAVGKKHESWVSDGIARYEKRLRKPFDVTWQLLPHSSREGDAARSEESQRILAKVSNDHVLILLDERGGALDSPGFAKLLQQHVDHGQQIVMVIGGAYGVDETVRTRANHVWSLSPLVFPHQLVRLVVTEQVYRAQEILAGRQYHHE